MVKKIIDTALFLLLLSSGVLAQTAFFVSPGGKNTNPGTKEKPFASIDHAKLQTRTLMKQLFLIIILLRLCFVCRAQNNLYVAVNGNDKYSGTLTKPLQSLEAALNKVASAKGKMITIFLRRGKYSLARTIVITPALLNNHYLQIAAYNSESVTITGAVKIMPQWMPYKNNIIQAFIGKALSIDQLFCNGKPLQMARYPNYDSAARVFKGTAADAVSPQRVKGWAHPEGGYVHALHQAEWGDFHYRILGKTDKDSLLLEGGWQNNR